MMTNGGGNAMMFAGVSGQYESKLLSVENQTNQTIMNSSGGNIAGSKNSNQVIKSGGKIVPG